MTGGGDRAPAWRRGPLFTDLYQLLMAQVYVEEGLADRSAQFELFYRSNPDYGSHRAGYAVLAGVGPMLEWMATLAFGPSHLAVLAGQRDRRGQPRFSTPFLDWLGEHGTFAELEVHGLSEGRVVHPHEPLLTITGPLAAAQLLETALLNQCSYPTLVATKAARVAEVAGGGRVLEFGMRRGPGAAVDEGARAALIGGCSATSNVQAAVALGTDPKGTHAHSLVQAYLALGAGELEAFRAVARRHPDECVLLVDTVDTLGSGVPNAIRTFEELRAAGHEPLGIRLDSGDLAHLAVEASRLLDRAGFPDVGIVLSGDLDELTIWQVLTQLDQEAARAGLDAGAVRQRLTFGVGTRLITSAGDSALGAVYKLTAIADEHGRWRPATKRSESPAKVPIVGPKRAWRLYDGRGLATVDLLTEVDESPFEAHEEMTVHHPSQAGVQRTLRRAEVTEVEELHQLLFAKGERLDGRPDLPALQARCRADVARLDAGVRRLVNPHVYHVSLSERLHGRQLATLAGLLPDG